MRALEDRPARFFMLGCYIYLFSTNKNREIRRDHHCVESRSGLRYNLSNLEASIWSLQLLYSVILRWSYEGVGSPSGAISHARMLDIFVSN